jgi:hypothetical protein
VLHVLNGDATAAVFADAGLPGERLVWRDIVVEGPVAAAAHSPLAARPAYLAERLGIDPDEYARGLVTQTAALATAPAHDEVVLWFEQDLFCAVTLWSLLDWLGRHAPTARLSLVYPAVDGELRGLGSMAPARLAGLFDAREPMSVEARAVGTAAWAAYASSQPLAGASFLGRDPVALPFVAGAFRCHLGRFPSVANGLNEVEAIALDALSAGRRGFGELFREVSAHPSIRPHGMGDVQFAAALRRLAPLLRIDGDELRRAELSLTPRGAAVAAGEEDWLDVQPIDAWLGGVHLGPGRPLWRWDGVQGRLVGPAG